VSGALTPLMESTGMDLSVNFEPGIISADIDLIKSVIFNTADNARKANEAAGRTKVSIDGHLDGDKYIISITDEGTGIPEDELDKITEAFYMVDKSRARKQGGAGLGLALCKQIMEQHGGTIAFESKLGEGTKIILTLNGKPVPDEEEEEGEDE
ncbi:MAG: ATP-binding protein, partial [Lachnospiraceae bacterium]|nr:ATP-binding protein [Lachnospiraceae bacterium]